jgi:hypothetical protein
MACKSIDDGVQKYGWGHASKTSIAWVNFNELYEQDEFDISEEQYNLAKQTLQNEFEARVYSFMGRARKKDWVEGLGKVYNVDRQVPSNYLHNVSGEVLYVDAVAAECTCDTSPAKLASRGGGVKQAET